MLIYSLYTTSVAITIFATIYILPFFLVKHFSFFVLYFVSSAKIDMVLVMVYTSKLFSKHRRSGAINTIEGYILVLRKVKDINVVCMPCRQLSERGRILWISLVISCLIPWIAHAGNVSSIVVPSRSGVNILYFFSNSLVSSMMTHSKLEDFRGLSKQ